MINTKKILLIIFIVLIPSIAIYSTISLLSKVEEEVKGAKDSVSICTPYITNMIPNVAYVNTEYFFSPRVVGCDMQLVDIKVSGVEWLTVTEGKYLYGIPSITDIGTHRIEISAISPTGSSKLIDYIIVK